MNRGCYRKCERHNPFRSLSLAAMLGVMACSFSYPANAALVSFWSFDSSNTTPTSGTQSGTATLTTSATATFVTGTTINDPRPSPTATPAIEITSGTLTIHVSGTGLSSFVITYTGQKNGGNGAQSWAYSTDGINFTILGSQPNSLGNSFASTGTETVNFSSATALNGAANVYFRNTPTIGTTVDFDNFQVTAVPETTNLALAVFGLCVVGLSVSRRVCFWAQA